MTCISDSPCASRFYHHSALCRALHCMPYNAEKLTRPQRNAHKAILGAVAAGSIACAIADKIVSVFCKHPPAARASPKPCMWTHEAASSVALYTLQWHLMGLKIGSTPSKDQCCGRRSPQACGARTLHLLSVDPGHQRGRGQARWGRLQPCDISVIAQRADAQTPNRKPYISRVWIQDTSAGAAGSGGGASSAATSV